MRMNDVEAPCAGEDHGVQPIALVNVKPSYPEAGPGTLMTTTPVDRRKAAWLFVLGLAAGLPALPDLTMAVTALVLLAALPFKSLL
jgi:hypothetical protein